MAIQSNFQAIKPSLNLDFANTKKLDSRVTFTRASTATYYDGVTTAKAEENLFRQSQALATSPWSQLRVAATNNDDTAPDGTNTATSIAQSAGQTNAGQSQQTYVTAPLTYTASVFAKPDGKNFLRFLETVSDGTGRNTWFDIQNGTIGTTYAGHTATITASTNGFYRCTITFTVNAVRTGSIGIGLADTDNSMVVVDSGGILAWGAQLEQRDAVTAYTPTTTQTITNYIPVLLTAANNVPRFDHNPTTDESLGLLVEEQRTNLQVYSAEFDNAAWSKTNSSITSNIIVAPDGTLTGDKLVEDTATGEHSVGDSFSFTSGTTYTGTIYAKKAERTLCRFGAGNTAVWAAGVIVDLSSGTITNIFAGSGTVTDVGNGWYRISITGEALLTLSTNFTMRLVSSGTTISYTGDGYSGIYIWGAQLEAGAFPTSYIATGAATATRSADAASMIGPNFSSWFNQGEGTFFAEFATATPTTARILQIGDGTGNNRVDNFMAANQFAVFVQASGSTQVTGSATGILAANVFGKVSFAYKTNDFAWLLNAGAVSTDASGVVPTVDQIGIGRRLDSGTFLNGTIRRISYYPLRLTNAQLQALTG